LGASLKTFQTLTQTDVPHLTFALQRSKRIATLSSPETSQQR